jgi:hypothetical protein
MMLTLNLQKSLKMEQIRTMTTNDSQEIEEKLTPQERLRAAVREDFYNGKIVPVGFSLPCPYGHNKTMFEYGTTWRCQTCRKLFENKDSSYWKKQDIGISNLFKEELNSVVEGWPDVKIIVEYVKIFTSDERQINRIINLRVKNGMKYGANESAMLAAKQLKEMLPNSTFRDGFSRGDDIIMVVDNGIKNENS